MSEKQETERTWCRPNLVKIRGYEFEEIVPWDKLIEDMKWGES